MGLMQKDVNATYFKGARSYNLKDKKTTEAQKSTVMRPSTLTFVTSDGESIVFDGMDIPVEEAAALMGEDALGKIWNSPTEDSAWRDM